MGKVRASSGIRYTGRPMAWVVAGVLLFIGGMLYVAAIPVDWLGFKTAASWIEGAGLVFLLCWAAIFGLGLVVYSINVLRTRSTSKWDRLLGGALALLVLMFGFGMVLSVPLVLVAWLR